MTSAIITACRAVIAAREDYIKALRSYEALRLSENIEGVRATSKAYGVADNAFSTICPPERVLAMAEALDCIAGWVDRPSNEWAPQYESTADAHGDDFEVWAPKLARAALNPSPDEQGDLG